MDAEAEDPIDDGSSPEVQLREGMAVVVRMHQVSERQGVVSLQVDWVRVATGMDLVGAEGQGGHSHSGDVLSPAAAVVPAR